MSWSYGIQIRITFSLVGNSVHGLLGGVYFQLTCEPRPLSFIPCLTALQVLSGCGVYDGSEIHEASA